MTIIDSADIGAKPGNAILLNPESLGGISFCTHQLSLQILTNYLYKSLKCKIIIIGIQPKNILFNKPASVPIKEVAQEVAQTILNIVKL